MSDPGSERVRDRETDEDLLELARAVAEEAAVLVRQRRRAGVEVTETKSSPVDVVTEADRAAEQLIYTRLTRARPGDGFLGEEGSSAESTTGVTWVVDPIDGTVNFLYGIPQYAVSIAARRDGEVVAGVVVNVVDRRGLRRDPRRWRHRRRPPVTGARRRAPRAAPGRHGLQLRRRGARAPGRRCGADARHRARHPAAGLRGARPLRAWPPGGSTGSSRRVSTPGTWLPEAWWRRRPGPGSRPGSGWAASCVVAGPAAGFEDFLTLVEDAGSSPRMGNRGPRAVVVSLHTRESRVTLTTRAEWACKGRTVWCTIRST